MADTRSTDARSTDTPSTELSQLSDAALLGLYVRQDDPQAFRTLVERHGPLVLSACRRSLYDQADADDAFQATFLVLAQSAHKIRRRESLAAWLYGVAARVSTRMRRSLPKETQPMEELAVEFDPLDELLARHDARVADEELAALSQKLRAPLVLRYLAGKSNAEVAEELNISIAALEGRLKRGKQQLRKRLIRRGVLLSALVATLKATQVAASELPISLVERTADICTAAGASTLAASSATSSSATSGSVANSPITHLAHEEIMAMKTLLIAKPLATLAAVGSIVVVTVASQWAAAQGESRPANPGVALQSAPGAASSGPASDANQRPAVSITPSAKPLPTLNPAAGLPATGLPAAALPATGLPATGQTVPYDPYAPPRTGAPIPAGPGSPGIASPQTVKFFADANQRSASELKIEAALAQQSIGFFSGQLRELATQLGEKHKISVVIDKLALDDLAIDSTAEVEIEERGIALESALNLLLRPLELTFIVKDEVLLITTQEVADSTFETRVYPFDSGSLNSTVAMELLVKVVANDTWDENGGEAQIVNVGSRLVINQTYAVHNEINKLLLQLKYSAPEGARTNTVRPQRENEPSSLLNRR